METPKTYLKNNLTISRSINLNKTWYCFHWKPNIFHVFVTYERFVAPSQAIYDLRVMLKHVYAGPLNISKHRLESQDVYSLKHLYYKYYHNFKFKLPLFFKMDIKCHIRYFAVWFISVFTANCLKNLWILSIRLVFLKRVGGGNNSEPSIEFPWQFHPLDEPLCKGGYSPPIPSFHSIPKDMNGKYYMFRKTRDGDSIYIYLLQKYIINTSQLIWQ